MYFTSHQSTTTRCTIIKDETKLALLLNVYKMFNL